MLTQFDVFPGSQRELGTQHGAAAIALIEDALLLNGGGGAAATAAKGSEGELSIRHLFFSRECGERRQST